MADANTAIVTLASVQGAATLVLAGATLFYARRTHDISQATREQADATSKMATEMREQTLAADQPHLLVEMLHLDATSFDEPENEAGSEPDPHAGYPTRLDYRMFNAGRGPAKEIGTSIRHPAVRYKGSSKDVLRPGDVWEVAIEPKRPSVALIEDSFPESAPKGLGAFLKHLQAPAIEPGYDCGVVVTYADIHDRRYLTLLRFGMIAVSDVPSKSVESRSIQPAEQRAIRLPDS